MAQSIGDSLQVLRNAIDMELEGMDFFERASERMQNPRAKDMFIGLVKQEQRHVNILAEELSRLEGGRDWRPLESARADANGLPKVSVFKDRQVRRLKLRPEASDLEVLRIGMEVEKKSMDFYKAAGAAVKDAEAAKLFEWLVSEETGHLAILKAEYDSRAGSGFYFGEAEFSLEVE